MVHITRRGSTAQIVKYNAIFITHLQQQHNTKQMLLKINVKNCNKLAKNKL